MMLNPTQGFFNYLLSFNNFFKKLEYKKNSTLGLSVFIIHEKQAYYFT